MSSGTSEIVQRAFTIGSGILAAFVTGVQLMNSNSLTTQLAETRELVRTIEEFLSQITPHEREKIERGQRKYFKRTNKKLRTLKKQLADIELEFKKSDAYTRFGHQYKPTIAKWNPLKKSLAGIVDGLENVHTDLLQTTSAIHDRSSGTDSDSEDEIEATVLMSAIEVHSTDQALEMLPIRSNDTPSASA